MERLAAGIAPADIALEADLVAAAACIAIALLGLTWAIYYAVVVLGRTEFNADVDQALAQANSAAHDAAADRYHSSEQWGR